MRAEDFSERPDFGEEETLPWERPGEARRWMWGADAGKLLTDIKSKELLRKRRWLERDPEGFKWLIDAIDAILVERAGE